MPGERAQGPIDNKLGKPKNQPGHGDHVTLLTRHTQIFLQNQMLIVVISLSYSSNGYVGKENTDSV
jgi:hypothetical protein